jgi:excisionase family DNA binding protein
MEAYKYMAKVMKALAMNALAQSGMLNVEETAGALGVKPATVRSWILNRSIKFSKIGRAVRISPHEIQRIIEQGEVPAQRRMAS